MCVRGPERVNQGLEVKDYFFWTIMLEELTLDS